MSEETTQNAWACKAKCDLCGEWIGTGLHVSYADSAKKLAAESAVKNGALYVPRPSVGTKLLCGFCARCVVWAFLGKETPL